MSTRYTKTDVRNIVSQLDIEAKQAGLLPLDHKLVYGAGNPTNGISATVTVQGPDGHYVHGYDGFIPEFTYKLTAKDQYRLLDAAIRPLYALRRQRESAAKAAQARLDEWVAAS